jgi:GEVED domain/HYR domain/SprB repeat/Secretion system C-terminal sorting domain
MPKTLQFTLALFLSIFGFIISPKLHACGFDFVGDCATSSRFSVNGTTSEYLVSKCPYGSSLTANFGSNITDFKLIFASTQTWESCTNKVIQSSILYRIFTNSSNKGSFQRVNLTRLSSLSNPPYTTKFYSDSLAINLLSNLQSNTAYNFEMYFEVGVDSDGNGSVDATGIRDNSGAYYASTFQTGNIGNTPPPFNVAVSTNPTNCKGGSDGSATVKSTNGTAPYTYQWSNGMTGDTLKNLKAGSYTVTATDFTGTKVSSAFTINEPTGISLNLVAANPACSQNNGSVAITPSGGLAPYTYKWSNGSAATSISNLLAGIYSVTVTDSKGCNGTASTTLIENCGTPGSYCNSSSSAPWNEWIGRVQLNTLDNTSSKTRSDKYALGYSDWKDKNTTITTNQSYLLTLSPGISYDAYKTNLYFRVWIDFNGNGTLDDTEIVLEKNSVSQAVSNTIIIPTTAKAGSTMMRVSMKKDANPTACETFAAGEVEDYSITILSGVPVNCDLDSVPPVLLNCPTNINLVTVDSVAIATWTSPTVTDNCTATPSVSSNYRSNDVFKIGITNVVITAKDAKNNQSTCNFNITVTKQVIDTTTGGGNDLGLMVESASLTFSRFTTKTFRVKVANTSTSAYTNIKIQFKYPTGTANGGAVVPSVGIWNSYCSGGVQCFEWTIPSLAANSVGTLDVPLFILDVRTPITATASLLSSTPVDTKTGNNTANLIINPAANLVEAPLFLKTQKPSQLVPIVVQSIEPTLTEGDMFVQLESFKEQTVDFQIFNALGKMVKVEKRIMDKGQNRLQFDVSMLQNGMYFIIPSTNIARNVPTKFVKI